MLSAVDIVVSADKVGSSEQFVQVYQRTYEYNRAYDAPEPEVCGTEVVCYTTSCELVADSVGYSVIPYKTCDSEGYGGDNKSKEAEVHSLFAVVARCNDVYAFGNRGHYDKRIDTERDD